MEAGHGLGSAFLELSTGNSMNQEQAQSRGGGAAPDPRHQRAFVLRGWERGACCACVPAGVRSEFGETSCFISEMQEFCIQRPNLSGFVSL